MADIAPINMTVDMTSAERLVADTVLDVETPDVATATDPDIVVLPADDAATDDPLPRNAAMQPDGSVILTLSYPVTLKYQRQGSDQVRTEIYETLHMHRLNGGHMRAIMSAGQGHTVPTGVAKSCRMAQHVFNTLWDKMDGADAAAAAAVFGFFLAAGDPKATGRPSSP